ncbi:hypothetical protein ERO13_A07G075600v2 [Gossypium hirsutum]|uniref:Non-specific lipid-transfer protein n=1 Tax=Gossypium hirsutum TaxID=3635 RepID=A0A1U8MH52_GOSHI|nr:non-specific lipid-transfer protein A [Gossypium hirsutum]KAG4191177.1 hypothetical protein ERO13_A07G075600v2 [Gossypium hirsutum]
MEKKFMGFSWSLVVVFLFIMILIAKSKSVDAITCQEALLSLMPCRPFLTGGESTPVATCCSAVANINSAATTTAIRKDLCRCLEAASRSEGVDPDKAKQLPQLCGVTVAISFDPTINCDTIK